MQFKVPQNIDMEDKIIGPMTMSQFFYVLFGGIVIYLLFNKLAVNGHSFLFVLLAFPIGLASLALAFVKVQDRPFPQFVVAALRYFSLPRIRVWRHQEEKIGQKTVIKRQPPPGPSPKKQLDNLRVRELAEILDSERKTDGQ